MSYLLPVLVHTPAYSQMAGPLIYRSESALPPGTLVRVPLGQRELLGVVWDAQIEPVAAPFDPEKLRPISATLDGIGALAPPWRQLITFTANYYQRSLGEVALAALPPQLRDLSSVQLARRLKRHGGIHFHEPAPPPRHRERSLGGSHAADSDMAIHVPVLHGLPRHYVPRSDELIRISFIRNKHHGFRFHRRPATTARRGAQMG
jgi:primosomal protein N'